MTYLAWNGLSYQHQLHSMLMISNWEWRFEKSIQGQEHYTSQTWVVKKFLPEAITGIEALGQTIEGQTRKAVQMHCLAQNFALQLKEKI